MTDNSKKIDSDFHDLLNGLPVFTGGIRARLIKLDSEARAAERTKTIEEMLELLVDEEENEHSGHEIDDFYCIQCGEHIGEGEQHPMETFGRNELRAELRAKLEAMKGQQ